MAGQRRLDGALGRLEVTDFADQNHVRVVPQNAAQAGRERQTDFAMDLDLAEALVVVLHRVFHRDDLDPLVLDLVEAAIQRRGFA